MDMVGGEGVSVKETRGRGRERQRESGGHFRENYKDGLLLILY